LRLAQADSSRAPISKKPFTKIGLVEWLKMKALSSSPTTAKTNKQTKPPKKTQKRADGVLKWYSKHARHEPSKCEALSSNPSTTHTHKKFISCSMKSWTRDRKRGK
jgi:hypothetical protein